MRPKLIEAQYRRDYVIHVRFSDGVQGNIDFLSELEGEVFEPLRNLEYFRKFFIHPELHTLTWPNDADFAPEFLYDTAAIPV